MTIVKSINESLDGYEIKLTIDKYELDKFTNNLRKCRNIVESTVHNYNEAMQTTDVSITFPNKDRCDEFLHEQDFLFTYEWNKKKTPKKKIPKKEFNYDVSIFEGLED